MSKKYIGNLVQSLSGGSGGGGGGDTGVGKPYPGSTGGEYFNYYGDDSNKNIASGNYSTTIGYNNKNGGRYSFCGGANNFIKDDNGSAGSDITFVFGENNGSSQYRFSDCFVLGSYNTSSENGHPNITIGRGNSSSGSGGVTFGNGCKNNGAYLYGDHLTANSGIYHPNCIVGSYNKTTYALTAPRFVVGVGTTDYGQGDRKNAIEIDSTECKILNNLQLNADTTSVNAITAPQDSSNVTTDDQTLATKSYVDANSGSGGVGQAYPNSTGGEIFNYYGTDSNKNVASGNYSTAIGYKNKSQGPYSFTGGYQNTNEGDYALVFGYNNVNPSGGYASVLAGKGNENTGNGMTLIGSDNKISNGSRNGVVLGYDNKGKCYWGVMIGSSNNSKTYDGARLIGDNLVASANEQFIFGRYNALNPTLSGANFIFGCGTDTNNKANFMEANYNSCKICNNLQLATDTTEVNAITPPQDPQNVTADDQTLVTKSWAGANYTNSVDLNINQSITPSTTSITIPYSSVPSWAKNILLTIRVNGSATTSVVLLKELTVNHSEFEAMSHYYNTSNSTFSTHWNNFSLTYNDTDSEYTLTWTKSLHYTQDMTTGTLTLVNDTIANSTDTITIMEIKALP